MAADHVVVVASPYEGERLRRLLEATGRRVTIADGGAADLGDDSGPVVLSGRLAGADSLALARRLIAGRRPVVVVGEAPDGLPDDVPRVARPVDGARLEAALREAIERPPAAPAAPPAPAAAEPDLAPPLAGELRATDVAALLGRLARDGFTGRLRATRGSVEKTVHFDEGAPVAAASTLPADRLGDQLLREGRITPAQYEAAGRTVAATGRRIGAVLLDLGALPPAELFAALRRHVEAVVLSLFAWEDGRFALDAEEAPAADRVRIETSPAALVVEGVRRRYGAERVLALVDGTAVLRPTGAAAGDLPLTAAQRSVLVALDGCTPLAEAAARAELGLIEAATLAWALVAVGAVERVAAPAPAAALAPPAPAAAPAPASEPDADPAAEARARLAPLRALVAEGDYFAVLGVARGADDGAVRAAFERACAEVAAAQEDASLAAAAAEVRDVLDEAWLVLGDDARREAYRAALACEAS